MDFIVNLKKSPIDERDYIFTSDKKYPESIDYTNMLNPVRNQGKQGTCYAQSASCMKEWQEFS